MYVYYQTEVRDRIADYMHNHQPTGLVTQSDKTQQLANTGFQCYIITIRTNQVVFCKHTGS